MNKQNSKRSVTDLHRAMVLGALVVLALSGGVNAQQETENKSDKSKIRQRIANIIRETLNRGEITTAEGHRIIVRSKPDDKDVEEIVSYGDDAVTVLAGFLKSENAREYELAMQLLSMLGGDRIVQPLSDVILFDPLPRKREYALRALTQAPWDQAEPIIRLSAKTDHDAHVRVLAEELLNNYGPSKNKALH